MSPGPPLPVAVRLAVVLVCAAVGFLTLAGAYGQSLSPDSYGLFLVGESLAKRGVYASDAIRDLHRERQFPQPSRSFPPLWPLAVGVVDTLSGLDIVSGRVAIASVIAGCFVGAVHLGRRLSPWAPRLPVIGLTLFLLATRSLQTEILGARTLPMVLLIVIFLLVAVLDAVPQVAERPQIGRMQWRWLWVGVLLGFLLLTRFDSVLFVGLLTAVIGRVWWQHQGARVGARCLAWIVVGILMIYAPWGARNMFVFGSPFASNNVETAVSLYSGIYHVAYFAADNRPPTVWQEPAQWLASRTRFVVRNVARLILQSYGIVVIAAACLWIVRRRVTTEEWWFALVFMLYFVGTLAAMSLTPYRSARYLILTFFGAIVLTLLALRHAGAAPERVRLIGSSAVVCMGLVMVTQGVMRMRDPHHALFAHQRGVDFQSLGDAIRARNSFAIVALPPEDTERFTYHTGIRSVIFPENVARAGDDYVAWLRNWRPDLLALPLPLLTSLGYDRAVISGPYDGLHVVAVGGGGS